MEKCEVNPDKWKLYQYNEFLGYFDAVVIAHNGKCADRLLSTTGDLTGVDSQLHYLYFSKATRINFNSGSISLAKLHLVPYERSNLIDIHDLLYLSQ